MDNDVFLRFSSVTIVDNHEITTWPLIYIQLMMKLFLSSPEVRESHYGEGCAFIANALEYDIKTHAQKGWDEIVQAAIVLNYMR